jgi:hypothetical protein
MFFKTKNIFFLRSVNIFVCLVFLWVSPTPAVVIRHDRDIAETIELGKRFDAVCKVIPDGSCVLIAPEWVATAAHVAKRLRAGSKIQFDQKAYEVKRVIIHPEGTSRIMGRPPKVDLALIELTEKVTGITPVKIYSNKDETGKTLFIVGYGDFGIANNKPTFTDGKRRAVTNKVDDAGPLRIFMKFDEPPRATKYEGVGGPGDSGGPALLVENDKIFLAGISSGSMNGKPGQYGVVDVYTRISSYTEWIRASMRKKAG